jgi:hypothetical protein
LTVALSEGNYKVTVTLGDKSGVSMTTVKSETGRLMLERIVTAKGKYRTIHYQRIDNGENKSYCDFNTIMYGYIYG